MEAAAADDHKTPEKELKRGGPTLAVATKKARVDEERKENKEKVSEKKNAKHIGDLEEKKKKAALCREAASLKEKYLRTVAVQSTIERQVAEDPAFEWARNDTQKQRFFVVKDSMDKSLSADTFNSWWLVNDIASAKKKFGLELYICLQKFVAIRPALENLELEQARFQKMHRANS